ncbi:energy transducer TonB [Shewanella acanthi]|nr:energy transducer TonB [Shewanella acanthi]
MSNAQVLDANPKRIFDKAAISAVMTWKYNPNLKRARPCLNSIKGYS